jgi:hypothetical protein
MSTHTRGLGRGLGALIPPAAEATQPELGSLSMADGILAVPVADIIPNPRQPNWQTRSAPTASSSPSS